MGKRMDRYSNKKRGRQESFSQRGMQKQKQKKKPGLISRLVQIKIFNKFVNPFERFFICNFA